MTDTLAELQRSLHQDLAPGLGFLPARTPARQLPARWRVYADAAAELARRYHAADADVVPWLTHLFATPVADASAAVAEMSEPERDRLLTITSVLSHAFRWASAPPRAESYHRTAVSLPPGLAAPWSALCAHQGHPRVGNLYSMVLSNWDLHGRDGGVEYDVADLHGDALTPAVLWLAPPQADGLRTFLRTPIETEARGAPVVATAVEIIAACSRGNVHAATDMFERLYGEIAEMAKPFAQLIRTRHFGSADFLTLIQPTTLWGLDEGEGVLEGASGPQVGVLQVLDALLGISRCSAMGTAVLHSRRYLPARHQRFLTAFDAAAPVVREFVCEAKDRALTSLFNACLSSMKAWRLVHQKRGEVYLRGESGTGVTAYASTGGVVALEDERVQRFSQAMQERVAETTMALLPQAVEDPLPERPLRYLTEHDLAELRAAAWVHVYATGEVILSAGVRRTGLFLLRSGEAKVRTREGTQLAQLCGGTLFGELSYLENAETSASVVAETECRVEIIPREHIYALCETRDGFAARFHLSVARIVASRLRETSGRLAAVEAELRACRDATSS